MSLKVINKKLFKKYNKIWERVNNLINIKLDSKPFYRDSNKNIQTKIKICEDKVNRTFKVKKKKERKGKAFIIINVRLCYQSK